MFPQAWGKRDVDKSQQDKHGGPAKVQPRSKGSSPTPQKQLLGYYDLAKEIVERAVTADEAGNTTRSVPLYSKALEVIREGLSLHVPSLGLGKADSVTIWKSELRKWEQEISTRLRGISSGEATTSQSVLPSAPQSHGRIKSGGQKKTSGALGTGANVFQSNMKSRRTATNTSKNASTNSDVHQKYQDMIMQEVLVSNPGVSWDDIAGLQVAKQALYESVILPTLRSDIFKGLRAPPRGLLLYGPPGNGKTLLAKALASKANATFFNISASSLTSKWVGEGEKLVRALFEMANANQPAIIFIDEIDSILSTRTSNENDAMRRLKTEILVQFDGVASGDSRVVVIGATNRPQELDDAARRRLVKRIYIPLPELETRRAIIEHLFRDQPHNLSSRSITKIAAATEGYSSSDLTALCKEAAMVSIRELGAGIQSVRPDSVRDVRVQDFTQALGVIRPSVNKEMMQVFEDFTREFGTK